MKSTVLILSCEYAVNTVPKSHQHLFNEASALLESSKAYDISALDISQHLQKTLNCALFKTSVTRLLIDCGHSEHHAKCFSKFTRKCSIDEKKQLIETYYRPFYLALENQIKQEIAQDKQVLHVSVNTFAPKIHGLTLNSGLGILYDANRHGEKEVARLIHGLLLQESIPYKVRLNYPFSGSKDYLLGHFRKKFDQQDYLGLRLEINQALLNDPVALEQILVRLDKSFSELMMLL